MIEDHLFGLLFSEVEVKGEVDRPLLGSIKKSTNRYRFRAFTSATPESSLDLISMDSGMLQGQDSL